MGIWFNIVDFETTVPVRAFGTSDAEILISSFLTFQRGASTIDEAFSEPANIREKSAITDHYRFEIN
jgi:hypothetical protein